MEDTRVNQQENDASPEVTAKKKKTKKIFGKEIGKNAFWLWIAYQTIKGTLTTALIWVPLIYMYLKE